MKCRACNGASLFDAIDLGNIPVAGAFLESELDSYTLYETKMLVCSECGLGQISVDLDPSDLYANYNWRTSTSKSYIEYIHNFAEQQIIPNIDNGDWVLEIASNDGTLLKFLNSRGVDVLGVDPAKNISLYAICDGVPIITEFFNADIARQILKIKGYPKWIVANNVMAHTPDIQSFMEGIAILSSRETIVTIENPTIMNILEKEHFDTIFHEHYSYLSATAVEKLAKRFNLNLFNIDWVDIQGGSNRYWLSKSESKLAKVDDIIGKEKARGLLDSYEWKKSYLSIKDSIDRFRIKVQKLNDLGAVVCGFAASAKSTVTMNFAGIKPGQILFVADDVKEKQERIIPGVMVPIVSTERMLDADPTDIIVFSWNIYDEIKRKIESYGSKASVWVWNS